MNSWGNEHFGMPNMNLMGMGGVMPNVIQGMGPPLVPPYGMMGDMNQMNFGQHLSQAGANQMGMMNQMGGHNQPQPGVLIGPVQPENQGNGAQGVAVVEAEQNVEEKEETQTELSSNHQQSQSNRDRNDRRERERERGRRRSRSRNRDRDYNKDRSNRGDQGDRQRSHHRERHSKWDNNDKPFSNQMMNQPNIMMPNQAHMMQYGNMMPNHMMQPQMDMSNMQQMMQMPGMNMMPNMMMMNAQMQAANQPIYFSTGVILPPLPGTSTPPRRERPPGCRTIFVGGISQSITENVITEIFQRYGDIDEVKLHKGVCHVRFAKAESVELSLSVSGWRLKGHDQNENEATTIFIDFALNREDQNEYEKNKRKRELTPPRVEPYTPATFTAICDKIKSDNDFAEAAPTLAAWLERGECNKKNANIFYSLIQASNNQLRRLFNEKMQIDEEYQTLKNTMRDKFAHILLQFEQVAKILMAARHQRVSDHFSKQQRRNIEMWLKMTEELDNIKEEFSSAFEEEEVEKGSKNVVPLEKYEQLRVENENLTFELEGYRNEAHLAKDEAERKFEKFKAHFIAQQALQNNKQIYPPLPSPPMPKLGIEFKIGTPKPQPPPPLPDDMPTAKAHSVSVSEAKLISMLSAFLMVHPRGASLDYLVSYVKSMVPTASQTAVHDVLNKYNDVFLRKTSGVGACIEHKWKFVFYDSVKLD